MFIFIILKRTENYTVNPRDPRYKNGGKIWSKDNFSWGLGLLIESIESTKLVPVISSWQ